jgi:hypothetical protein
MRVFKTLLAALLTSASVGAETLVVEILEPPTTVWTYSPVHLTVAVTNYESHGVLVPLDGFGIETALEGESLRPANLGAGSTVADRVVWLEPGARWLDRLDVSTFLVAPGTYQVRANLRSFGQCRVLCSLVHTIPVPPVGKGHFADYRYECWKGDSDSEVVTITSAPPPGENDAAALEWLRSDQYPGFRDPRPFFELTTGYTWLKERFPQSYYTYVGGLYGNTGFTPRAVAVLEELLVLQPSHPLTSETRLRLALAKARNGVPISLEKEMDHLPASLAAYLEQESRPKPTLDDSPCAELRTPAD